MFWGFFSFQIRMPSPCIGEVYGFEFASRRHGATKICLSCGGYEF